jgi:hydrophobe/amphiphile efflux-1 (HAE1) family protein
MRLSHFFIERPIFAIVVSLFITIFGGVAYFTLSVAQYPEIVPPTIAVATSYPGASADVVTQTVATPLEQQINGVENMLYMSAQSTGDGKLTLTVTFRQGSDIDTDQVLTQNRVSAALARLPDAVQRLGVTVQKQSPDLLLVIHILSPKSSRDLLYLSNYATLHVRDTLLRQPGVGDVQVFGARDYAMRIWLDPHKIAARGLTADDVVTALRAQNQQVSAGVLGEPPDPTHSAFQINIQALGRLTDPSQFADIIVKTDANGRITRVRDIGYVELGSQDYGANGYLDNKDAVPILVFQQPGTNAIETANNVRAAMAQLSKAFPPDVQYNIVYDTSRFVAESVHDVFKTIFIAILLVVLVVIAFLQTWRASIIPIVAIPVSLIGTFGVMAALGFSLNTLSLFGLVLAVGIVVDDAIVVVENVERNLRLGMTPREAAHKTMDEVGGALIAIALTLCAVFVPSAFISGLSGQFFKQFAATISSSTIISCFVSLTLSPALCALLFKGHVDPVPAKRRALVIRPIFIFFEAFNFCFSWLSRRYGALTSRLTGFTAIVMAVYAGLVALTILQFHFTPTGFVPLLDQGYLKTLVLLPPGSSLERTDEVVRKVSAIMLQIPGVEHTVSFAGLDALTFTNPPNEGGIFSGLEPFSVREPKGETANEILGQLQKRLSGIQDAFIVSVPPAPVPGIGDAGGFKMVIEDRGNNGYAALDAAAHQLMYAANNVPGLAGVFTMYNARSPNIYANIDRKKAEMLGVSPDQIFSTMQDYLGSAYINDFNYLGRTYEVTAQAEGADRSSVEDISRLETRNNYREMVPIGSVASFTHTTAPFRVQLYNLYPGAELEGSTLPGVSSSYALSAMAQLANKVLPPGFGYEWTELAFQEELAGNTAMYIFAASVLFVFLVLAANYESWRLPAAIVLIMPMCLLAAVFGLNLRGLDVDILAQIGFIVLIGLAAKNAILIVEFARQAEEAGATPRQAAIQAATTRLRPILMTSLAFLFGVLPLVTASGAGAEMRQLLGTAVFAGMFGVTLFGLLFTPVFYILVRTLFQSRKKAASDHHGVPAE